MNDVRKKYLKSNIIILSICFILCSFLSVSYAYLSSTLDIGGTALLKSPDDIRLIDNVMTGSTNGGLENYNPDFIPDTFTNHVILPNLNSTVTYTVSIKNTTDKDYIITQLQADAFSNNDMEYFIDGINVGSVIASGTTSQSFTITYEYKASVLVLPVDTTLNAIINFMWAEAYTVTYNVDGGSACNPASKVVAYNYAYGSLCSPTKADSTFNGWYTGADGTGTLINSDSYVELTSSHTLYANWTYEEGVLATNYPVLTSGMIPVVYNDATHVWVKADLHDTWYDYSTGVGNWANMVTVTSTNRATYLAASPGTTIPIADINGMYVWIPRYSYAIMGTWGNGGTSSTSPGSITIKFVNTSTYETGDAAYASGEPTSSDWRTHPAFWWDLDNDSVVDSCEHSKGFWMAKFEASPNTACTAGTTVGSGCDVTTTYPIMKPNVAAWRGIRVSTASANVVSYMNGSNGNSTYGLPNDSSQFEAYVMTNSDWGAVAYLTQSIYGKYGNANYSIIALKEAYVNNSSSYYTGRSGGRPGYASGYTVAAGCFDYDGYIRTNNTACNSSGNFSGTVGQYLSGTNLYLAYGASTTGTIYGVYGMSGGANEWVMIDYYGASSPYNYSGSSSTANTGFNGTYGGGGTLTTGRDWPQFRFYNRLTSTTFTTACGGVKCYGQALSEVYSAAGWYADTNGSGLTTSYVGYARGGAYNSAAASGIFHATRSYGTQTTAIGFRPVIRPIN